MTRSHHRRAARRWMTTALLSLALPAGAHRAQADAPPSSPSADAAAAFRNGLTRYESHDYVGAISTWEGLVGTLGEERGWKILYNLGLAYQAVNDVTRAIDRFETFARRVAAMPQPLDPELAARYEDARQRARSLEQSYGSVVIPAAPGGGQLMTRVGRGEPRLAGYTVYLAPGPQSIELETGTARAHTVQVNVVPGRELVIDTSSVVAAAAASRVAPAPVSTGGSTAPTNGSSPATTPAVPWGWIGAGTAVTAASFAAPLALYLVAAHQESEARDLGAGDTGYASARDRYDTTRTVYFASYALPAALAAATVVVALTRRDRGGEQNDERRTWPQAWLTPLGIRGRF